MAANPKLARANGTAISKYNLYEFVSWLRSACMLNNPDIKLSGMKKVASHVNRATFLLSSWPRRESPIEMMAVNNGSEAIDTLLILLHVRERSV